VAAAGSYLSARSRGGRWYLRIDDLDRARCRPDQVGSIPRTLEAFGFEWDGSIDFQSIRIEEYRQALDRLVACGRCYACRCSRATLAASVSADPGAEPVYPGTCRSDPQAGSGPHALRFAVSEQDAPVSFDDAFQGFCRQDCRHEAGDFIVRRRDGIFAYHLAVVVDDARLGVTEVVRGADLLSSTPRQILLQRVLGLPTPSYGHLPVLTESDGRKMAKSRHSLPVSANAASRELWQALGWLGQAPPPELEHAAVRELWSWAIPNWKPDRLAGVRERRLPPAIPV
jgi:glutamyl-Q tRNA(Asp) synthetase